MSREQVTLYGDDAEWFRSLREQVADKRSGTEPSNAELARLMMQRFETHSERL